MKVTRAWHQALEKGNSVACVFFDISKAFDTLPHHLILFSLTRVGICGSLLLWLQDYLSDRSQRVVLYGSASSTASVTSGVPQGSILGPLLFVIFMDSISTLSISHRADMTMFADDICYYLEVSNAADCAIAQDDVNLINDWMAERDLRLNVSKTKAMVVSRKLCPPNLEIKVGDSYIECVTTYRYLGITITSNLSWSLHINQTCSKAKRLVGYLYRHFRQADSHTIASLYKSIILPILGYAASVWDPYQKTYVRKLERVQEFAAKVVTRMWKTPGSDLVCQLGWPSLLLRRQLAKLCLCRRILSGESLIPAMVFEPHPSTSVRHVNTQSLFLPRVRTDYHRGSFFVSTIPLWNSIPDKIVEKSTKKSFKLHLKQYLL